MDLASLFSEFTRRHAAISVLLFFFVYALASPAPGLPDPDFGPTDIPRPPRMTVAGPATSVPPIWVGSPVTATWGNAGRPGSTPAGGHHLLDRAEPGNQWAIDLPVGAGTAVVLYAAAADPAFDAAITTSILQISDDNTCMLGGGGDFVTVGIYFGPDLAGRVTFAHLDRDPTLRVGTIVPRWGTTLGKVASLRGRATGGSRCWTGPHVHLELRSDVEQACWSRTYSTGRKIRRGDSLGLVSGPLGQVAAPCP